jgi:acetylornithine deacetylase/succinyl-diaminopimelate desuccinylase-like protein
MQEARIALEPAMFPRDAQRILPVVREYFRNIAPTRVAFGPSLSNIDDAVRQGQFWKLPTPYRDLTQDSLWVGTPSQDSGKWKMVIRLVNLPDTIPEERLAWLERTLAPYGIRIAEVRQKEGPVPVSATSNPLFALLAKQAKERYDVPAAGVQVLYTSWTDSRFLRQHGIDCYGVCPYPVDIYQSNSIHHADERIRLDGFMEGIDFVRTVLREWARAEP